MLLIKDVRKTYSNQTRAIEHVTFSLDSGDLAVLLGKEGAGKTSLLRCMAGILPFEGGDVLWKRHSLKEDPFLYKRDISFLPKDPLPYPFLTGQEYGLYVAAACGISARKAKARLQKEAKDFDSPVLKKRVQELSSEERRILQLLVGFSKDPQVFLLDDPFSDLPFAVMQVLVDKLRAMSENGGIVFFSDETLSIAHSLCNRVILLEEGELAFDGRLEDLHKSGKDLSAYRENLENEE